MRQSVDLTIGLYMGRSGSQALADRMHFLEGAVHAVVVTEHFSPVNE
jgi:hypothetical protein